MSELFSRLNKILLSVKPDDVSQLLIDRNFNSDFAEALEFLYVDVDPTDQVGRYEVIASFEKGDWDAEIKKYVDDIFEYCSDIHTHADARQRRKEKERDEVDNWQKYEKELGTKREADVDDVLGAYAFPSSRSQKLPKEPDTSAEKAILRALNHHLDMSGEIPKNISDDIVEILKSGTYSKVFMRCEPGTEIYRGMSVPQAWLESALGHNFEPSYVNGEHIGPLTFTPREGKYSTSWSVRERIASNFSPDRYKRGSWSVLLTCEVAHDMYALDCSKLYFALPQFDGLAGENEIICFGSVKCKSVNWSRSWLCQKNLIVFVRIYRVLILRF